MAEQYPKAKSQDKFKSKMTVKSQEPVGSFKRGDSEQTIYKVEAVNAEGAVITAQLRTFHDELPIDKLEEYLVEPYYHKDFGQTYTLKMSSKGHASKKDISDLTRQLTDLANRVSAIETQLQEMRQTDQKEQELDERWGKEAPWDD